MKALNSQEEEDPVLVELQRRIFADTAELLQLEAGIEQISSDADEQLPTGTAVRPKFAGPVTACDSLNSARRQQRRLQRLRVKLEGSRVSFCLRDVDCMLRHFVLDDLGDVLELPRYTAPQRKQARSTSLTAC